MLLSSASFLKIFIKFPLVLSTVPGVEVLDVNSGWHFSDP